MDFANLRSGLTRPISHPVDHEHSSVIPFTIAQFLDVLFSVDLSHSQGRNVSMGPDACRSRISDHVGRSPDHARLAVRRGKAAIPDAILYAKLNRRTLTVITQSESIFDKRALTSGCKTDTRLGKVYGATTFFHGRITRLMISDQSKREALFTYSDAEEIFV
ncbi:hypothetical protein COCCADRAFT_31216 [Bipolaris zeicola 26-R-13]|uniref:Uncharacterized protein n=1 Tax=Cochliobolus carbonum (strain 26-R-13) TaxID=930089 RepID=W6Y853_COCC2|nr:uncharacterized protein COCCADRAFT_31216 [Bipolaris zeicola 26-R-13]EUC27256.1 hypothetical protein COCCADRAFT_31216 [Bipolaris zeicola 26-R-13]